MSLLSDSQIVHIVTAILHFLLVLNSIIQLYRVSIERSPKKKQPSLGIVNGHDGNEGYDDDERDLMLHSGNKDSRNKATRRINPRRYSDNDGDGHKHSQRAVRKGSMNRVKLVVHGLNLLFNVIRVADWSYTSQSISVDQGSTIKIAFSRLAVSIFFTLVSYVTLQWALLAKPAQSRTSFWGKLLFAVTNILFYATVVIITVVASEINLSSSVLNLPLGMMTAGGFIVLCFFTYSAIRLICQANEVVGPENKRSFRRFLIWFTTMSCLCSLFFLVRFVVFVVSSANARAATHDVLITTQCGLGMLVCNLLALWLPELTTSAFISALYSPDTTKSEFVEKIQTPVEDDFSESDTESSRRGRTSTEISSSSLHNPFKFLFENSFFRTNTQERYDSKGNSIAATSRNTKQASSATPLLNDSTKEYKDTYETTDSSCGTVPAQNYRDAVTHEDLVEDRKETIVQICLATGLRHMSLSSATAKNVCVVGQGTLVEDAQLQTSIHGAMPENYACTRTEVCSLVPDSSLSEQFRIFHSLEGFFHRAQSTHPAQCSIESAGTSRSSGGAESIKARSMLSGGSKSFHDTLLSPGRSISQHDHRIPHSFGETAPIKDLAGKTGDLSRCDSAETTPGTKTRRSTKTNKASFNLLLRMECPYTEASRSKEDSYYARVGDTTIKNVLIRFGVFAIDDKLTAECKSADKYSINAPSSPFLARMNERLKKDERTPVNNSGRQWTYGSETEDDAVATQEDEAHTERKTSWSVRTLSYDGTTTDERPFEKHEYRNSNKPVSASDCCVGFAEIDVKTLLSSVSGHAPLPVWSFQGNVLGILHVRVAAMKQGKVEYGADIQERAASSTHVFTNSPLQPYGSSHQPLSFGSRVSRWFNFTNGTQQNLVIEEDLRESVYCFDVPRKLTQERRKEREGILKRLRKELKNFSKRANGPVTQGNAISFDDLTEHVQGRTEHSRVADCLTKCIESVTQQIKCLAEQDSLGRNGRGPGGISFKRSSSKKSSELRFLPLNLHVQEMRVRHLGPSSILPTGDVENFSREEQVESSPNYRNASVSPYNSATEYVQMIANTLKSPLATIQRIYQEISRAKRYVGDAWSDFVHNPLNNFRSMIPVAPVAVEHVVKLWVPEGMWGMVSNHNVSINSHSYRVRYASQSSSTPSHMEQTLGETNEDTSQFFSWEPSIADSGVAYHSTTLPIQEYIYDTITVGAFAAHCFGFEHGGLRQSHKVLREKYASLLRGVHARGYDGAYVPFLESLEKLLSELYGLKKEDMDELKRQTKTEASGANPRRDDGGHDALNLQERMRRALQLAIDITSREDVVICQAATALVTCFSRKIRLIQRYMHPLDGRKLLRQFYSVGFLFLVQSLLSTFSDELGMLQDFAYGVRLLKKFRIQLLPPGGPRAGSGSMAVPDDGRNILARSTDEWKSGGGGAIAIVSDKGYYTIKIRMWPMPDQGTGVVGDEYFRSKRMNRTKSRQTNKGTRDAADDQFSDISSSFPSRMTRAWMEVSQEDREAEEPPYSPGWKNRDLETAYSNAKAFYGKQFAALVPDQLLRGEYIYITPVIFNQGVNEAQTMSNWAYGFGSSEQQNEINKENLESLLEYFGQYKAAYQKETTLVQDKLKRLKRKYINEPYTLNQRQNVKQGSPQQLMEHYHFSGLVATAEPSNVSSNQIASLNVEVDRRQKKIEKLDKILRQMSGLMEIKREKRIDMLSLASSFTRMVHGGVTISCKSAKDRSSMIITLEQARILEREHGLTNHDRLSMAEFMRRHGVRRLNALKNVGNDKYAFNPFQKAFLPSDLRPPTGTGGGGIQS
eukprot:gb/GECG01001213.1/.p1 GENE.gb/GECG01001213.1/~~gb/GECG01001213.1/.p1  ORF type:complete len:1811 (+),score=178.29 gb/GECG01001213.1/:1-5433(+)